MESLDTAPQPPRRVLIVDDHPIVIRGLSMLIADEPDLEVCGEAEDVVEALRQVQAVRPDVVVVDLTLKSGHGLELIQRIRACDEQIRIVVSSMHDESLFAERALRAGARGYVNKQEPPDRIIEAIRRVLRGEIYLSAHMAGRILQRAAGDGAPDENPLSHLTDRELGVFEMIGRGLATRQIASRLNLSIKTIETHREKIKAKLHLGNASELVRHATQWVLENG